MNDITNIQDSESGKTANADNVINYLENRIKRALPVEEEMKGVKEAIKRYQDKPENAEALLDEQEEENKDVESPQLKEDFNTARARYTEFKSAQGIFAKLMDCVTGSVTHAEP